MGNVLLSNYNSRDAAAGIAGALEGPSGADVGEQALIGHVKPRLAVGTGCPVFKTQEQLGDRVLVRDSASAGCMTGRLAGNLIAIQAAARVGTWAGRPECSKGNGAYSRQDQCRGVGELMQLSAQTAARFERLLDRSRDPDGFVYSVLKADELRPWRNGDFVGKGYDLWDHWSGDFAGATNYEDCIMAAGRYAVAKILRQSAVGGDAAADRDAEQAVKALLAVSREGDKIESGYLPKPYGGLRRASESRNISTDQYEHALFALWHFRQACPDSPLVPEIESTIARWADYFIRHEFAYDYYGRIRVGIGESVHGLGLFLPLMATARRITGKREYAQILERRLFPLVREHLLIKEDSPAWIAHPNVVNLIVMGLVYCWQNDICRKECGRAIGLWTRLGLEWMSKDGLAYCYAEGSDANPVLPHYTGGTNPLNLRFLQWRSNVKGACSCKIAHTLALAHEVLPQAGWRDKAISILGAFDDVTDFRHYHDPGGDQIPAEFAYMREMLSLQCLGAWFQSYHLIMILGRPENAHVP